MVVAENRNSEWVGVGLWLEDLDHSSLGLLKMRMNGMGE